MAAISKPVEEQAIHKSGLQWTAELLAHEVVVALSSEKRAGRQVPRDERVAEAKAEQIILETGCFADEQPGTVDQMIGPADVGPPAKPPRVA